MKNVLKILASGEDVKVSIESRGRQLAHPERAKDLLNRIMDESQKVGKPQTPALKGRAMSSLIKPKN